MISSIRIEGTIGTFGYRFEIIQAFLVRAKDAEPEDDLESGLEWAFGAPVT